MAMSRSIDSRSRLEKNASETITLLVHPAKLCCSSEISLKKCLGESFASSLQTMISKIVERDQVVDQLA